jgi:hypothetical protein
MNLERCGPDSRARVWPKGINSARRVVMNQNRGYAIAAVILSGSLVGCGAEDAKLRASKMGDLTYGLRARGRPDVDQQANCGTGKLTGVGAHALRRMPYLQQVTESSALVLFTAAKGEGVNVDVSTPYGRALSSVMAVKDESARLGGSTWQGLARIQGLAPNTLYCYALRGMTERAGFRTAPNATSAKPVRFIAFGDSGDGSAYQYDVGQQMFTVPFDLVLHTGDLAYDEGTLGQLERGFFQVYGGIARSFPVFPVAGNHDYSTQGAAPFRQAFALPENGRPQGLESWYSFDWGSAHFVGLDTERIGLEQATWLERDLAATEQPWKIVFGHRPPFSSGQHGSNSAFREYFVPTIRRHHVALVLSGHDHDYERTQAIDGTTYIVTGGGGESTRAVGSSDFTAFSEETLHFIEVDVDETELLVHAIDGTGVEFDSARISRPDLGTPQ